MPTYICEWNDKRKIVVANNRIDLEMKFQERFGFFPDNVEISSSHLELVTDNKEID